MILASGFTFTHVLAGTVAVAYLLPALVKQMRVHPARLVVLAAWLAHAVVLASGLIGATPRFGFAPALSGTVWLVGAVYAIESQFYPQLQIRRAMCVVAAVGVLLALAFPGTPLHPAASVWLPLHWVLGIGSP